MYGNSGGTYINDLLTSTYLLILENEKLEWVRIRAKLGKIEKDEKSTRYFYKKEKSRGEQKQIHTLIHDDVIFKEKEEILEEITDFYQHLYNSEGTNKEQIEENLKTIEIKLEDNEINLLGKPISTKEIKSVVKAMAKNKSPGEDGIPMEFYEHFYESLEGP